jgi:hypothetical protein
MKDFIEYIEYVSNEVLLERYTEIIRKLTKYCEDLDEVFEERKMVEKEILKRMGAK